MCSGMMVCRHQVLVPLAAPSIATLICDVSITLNMPQTTSGSCDNFAIVLILLPGMAAFSPGYF